MGPPLEVEMLNRWCGDQICKPLATLALFEEAQTSALENLHGDSTSVFASYLLNVQCLMQLILVN